MRSSTRGVRLMHCCNFHKCDAVGAIKGVAEATWSVAPSVMSHSPPSSPSLDAPLLESDRSGDLGAVDAPYGAMGEGEREGTQRHGGASIAPAVSFADLRVEQVSRAVGAAPGSGLWGSVRRFDDAAAVGAAVEEQRLSKRRRWGAVVEHPAVEAATVVALIILLISTVITQGSTNDMASPEIPQAWVEPLLAAAYACAAVTTLEALARVFMMCLCPVYPWKSLSDLRRVYSLYHNAADAVLQLVLVAAVVLRVQLRLKVRHSSKPATDQENLIFTVCSITIIAACILRFVAIAGRQKTRTHATHVSAGTLTVRSMKALRGVLLLRQLKAARRDHKMSRDLSSRNRLRIARAFFGATAPYFISQQKGLFFLLFVANAGWAFAGPWSSILLNDVLDILKGSGTGDGGLQYLCALMFLNWFCCTVVSQGLVYYIFSVMQGRATREMRSDVAAFALAPNEANHDRFGREKLLEMMTESVDIATSIWSYAVSMWSISQAALAVFISVGYLVSVDQPGADYSIVLIVIMLFALLLLVLPSRAFRRAEARHTDAKKAMLRHTETMLKSRETLDAVGATRVWLTEWDSRNDFAARRYANQEFMRKSVYWVWYCGPQGFTTAVFVLLALAIQHRTEHKMPVSTFVAVWSLINSIASRLGGMASFFNALDNTSRLTAPLCSILTAVRAGEHVGFGVERSRGVRRGRAAVSARAAVHLERQLELRNADVPYVTRVMESGRLLSAAGAVEKAREQHSNTPAAPEDDDSRLFVSVLHVDRLRLRVASAPSPRGDAPLGSLTLVSGGTRRGRRALMHVCMLRRRIVFREDAAQRGGGRDPEALDDVSTSSPALLADDVRVERRPTPVLAPLVSAVFGLSSSQLVPGATVAENVVFGRRGAGSERAEIVAACELSGCARWVEALPRGYDTVLTMGRGGVTADGVWLPVGALLHPLSRVHILQVALARALLKRPRVLFVELWAIDGPVGVGAPSPAPARAIGRSLAGMQREDSMRGTALLGTLAPWTAGAASGGGTAPVVTSSGREDGGEGDGSQDEEVEASTRRRSHTGSDQEGEETDSGGDARSGPQGGWGALPVAGIDELLRCLYDRLPRAGVSVVVLAHQLAPPSAVGVDVIEDSVGEGAEEAAASVHSPRGAPVASPAAAAASPAAASAPATVAAAEGRVRAQWLEIEEEEEPIDAASSRSSVPLPSRPLTTEEADLRRLASSVTYWQLRQRDLAA